MSLFHPIQLERANTGDVVKRITGRIPCTGFPPFPHGGAKEIYSFFMETSFDSRIIKVEHRVIFERISNTSGQCVSALRSIVLRPITLDTPWSPDFATHEFHHRFLPRSKRILNVRTYVVQRNDCYFQSIVDSVLVLGEERNIFNQFKVSRYLLSNNWTVDEFSFLDDDNTHKIEENFYVLLFFHVIKLNFRVVTTKFIRRSPMIFLTNYIT